MADDQHSLPTQPQTCLTLTCWLKQGIYEVQETEDVAEEDSVRKYVFEENPVDLAEHKLMLGLGLGKS